MTKLIQKLGVNYLWGIINFTAGVTLGGIYVAVLIISAKLL
jgi:hypothetical protein